MCILACIVLKNKKIKKYFNKNDHIFNLMIRLRYMMEA